jgi:hypothetical protein
MGRSDIQSAAEQIKRFGGVNTRAVVGVGWCTWSPSAVSVWKGEYSGGGGGRLVHMVSLCSVGDPMVWTGTQLGFAVRVYFENNRSVVATQRTYRATMGTQFVPGLGSWRNLIAH